MKKFFVISYDISDDRKRYLIDKELKNNGVRVQKSVFECIITDAQFVKLREKLEKFIDHETDSIRYYYLCKGCIYSIQSVGNTSGIKNDDFQII